MRRPLITWRTAYWATAGLVLGVILHISVVLAVPEISPDTAWRRLSGMLPTNKMSIAPPARPEGQLLPFMAPDMRYAICKFDLGSGALGIKARMLDATWTLTLYTAQGENFFTVTSTQLQRPDLDLTVLAPPERSLLDSVQAVFVRASRETRGTRESGLQVTAPAREGLAVLRAPLLGTAFQAETNAALAVASCTALRRVQ
jgi:uncharacterized membrane protein